MSRKFESGQSVVMTNPQTAENRNRMGQSFQILRYDSDERAPYRLYSNGTGFWARAGELTLASEYVAPVVETPAPVEVTPVPTETEEDLAKGEVFVVPPVVEFENPNVNSLYLVACDFKKLDKVKVKRVVTAEMAETLYFDAYTTDWTKNRERIRVANERLNQEGYVMETYSNNLVRVAFKDGDEWMLALNLEVVHKAREIITFRASEDYDVLVTDTGVGIGTQDFFTFDFFEAMWKEAKEHIANGTTGEDRRYPINYNWGNGYFRDKGIKVGCQTFPYDNLRRLVAAIRVARKG